MISPRDKDWDRFWVNDRAGRFSRLSWAKRRIIFILRPFLQSGKAALDAGCGSGFFSKIFCDAGMHTVALDYSEGALAIADRVTEGRAVLRKADLLTNDLPASLAMEFDVIFSDGLLEHFTPVEQQRILANLILVLNGGGIIVTFVPNRHSPWQWIRPFLMPGIKEEPFVLKELEELHFQAGLQVIESGGVNVFPFHASPEKWLGKNFGMLLYVIARKNASSPGANK